MRTWTLLLALLVPATAVANDGRNRYESVVPARLVHLNGPVSRDAGFRVLAKDVGGGADRDPAYRWAQRHAVALVRLASQRVESTLGPGPFPLAIFDLSSENADTPIQFTGAAPRGRHPGGSHDGGQNLDLGYYLTSERGKLLDPDAAACTEHYTGENDENMCTGPADRLDTDRQALFLLEWVRVHQDRFAGELLEAIGIDAVIRRAVLERAREWQARRRHATTAAQVDELERLFASSPYEGWARFHHHHVHIRLQSLDEGGRHARTLSALVAEDRLLEARLLAQAGGEAAAAGVALGAELFSQSLERELDLRLLGEPPALAAVRGVRFRAGGTDWEPPADPLEPLHHVVAADSRSEPDSILAEAEVEWRDGSRRILRRRVHLPRQPDWLRARIDAAGIAGRARVEGQDLVLGVDLPPVASLLVTKIELVVSRRAGAPERLTLSGPEDSARVREESPSPVERVLADVTVSGRMHLLVPIWVRAPATPPTD